MKTPLRYLNQVLLVCLILSLFTLELNGQIVHFVQYGTESGLPQSQVQTIEQDAGGNLWLGTLSGLTRYNGKEFITFTKRNGLSEDWVTTSYKDKEGNLWFGHWTGGISKYNVERQTFESIGIEEFLEFRSVTSIMQDKDGNLWFGSNGSGVVKYEARTNKIILINRTNGLSSNNISCIKQDSYGNVWFGTDNGITIYNTRSDIASSESFAFLNDASGLPSNGVTQISMAFENQVWVSLAGYGIVVFELKNDIPLSEFTSLPSHHFNPSNGLASVNIKRIYQDVSKNIWLGTQDMGIFRFTPEKPEEKIFPPTGIFRNFTIENGLNYNRVNDIFQDREGNVWIATDLGLNQYRGDQFQLFDESFGVANNIIWAIAADHLGNIWLGTNEGVSRLSPVISDGSQVKKYAVTNYSTRDGLPANSVRSIFKDATGKIWFGTAGAGAAQLDPQLNKFKIYNTDNGIADNVILSICGDNEGNIWFGTPRGASRLNQTTGTINNFSSISGLGGNSIFRIFKDNQSNLWMGSLGGALTMSANSKFTVFDEKQGFYHKFILSIAEDKSGNVWFGTYGGGLYRYLVDSPDKIKFKSVSPLSGSGSQTPYSILCDADNTLWIGTNSGIDQYDLKEGTINHYGRREGFMGIENNANSAAIDRDGNLWFGTIMGALKFNPGLGKINAAEPITSLIKIRINKKDTLLVNNSILSYDNNSIGFYFIGVCLTNPEKVKYRYTLEGFDKEWLPVTREDFVNYSNLPHGKYTFLLKASNDADVWNRKPVTFSFSITPPFWLTWWFYLISAVVLSASVYLFIRIRERKLIIEKKHLEEIVRQRTQELAAKHAELAEKNKDITDSITYAKRIQEAMLPSDSDRKTYFPESFIFYKPKAIVSGDFYWMNNTGSGSDGDALLIAACDCTGHGVPGAFMSMLCSSLLNEAVTEKQLKKPAAILDEVRKGIITTLRQKGETGEQKDGMDAALCCITALKNGRTRFQSSCANNALWIVKRLNGHPDATLSPQFKIKSENEKFTLFEVPADRQPVSISERAKPFTHHECELLKGDIIYLFSDGIEDQFGGPDGKKFKASRLREIIMEIADKPLEEQYRIIEKQVCDWMVNYEQLDDILLIGVKI